MGYSDYFKEAFNRNYDNYVQSLLTSNPLLESMPWYQLILYMETLKDAGWTEEVENKVVPTNGGETKAFIEKTLVSPDGKELVQVTPSATTQSTIWSAANPKDDPSQNWLNDFMAGGAGLFRSGAFKLASPFLSRANNQVQYWFPRLNFSSVSTAGKGLGALPTTSAVTKDALFSVATTVPSLMDISTNGLNFVNATDATLGILPVSGNIATTVGKGVSKVIEPITYGALQAIMNLNYSIPFLTNNKALRTGFGKVLNTFGLGTGVQNIRYRDGIRDYFGNVLSKYSTIASKPTIFTGNLLELARKRVLDNLEKYGIRDTDYVSWTTTTDDPNLILLSKSIGFEIPNLLGNNSVKVTMPAKTYLEHISPIPGIEARFKPNSATIIHQNSDYFEDIQKVYPEFIDAHEFSHAIDWVLHNKTTTLPKTNGVHIQLDDSPKGYGLTTPELGSKIDLTKKISEEVNVPGLNYNRLKLDIKTIDYLRKPTELKARYEQIRNWLGVTDERPLTLAEWNLAKRYYTSSVGDNNMLEFFKLVENPEKFINWASKRYPTNHDGSVARATIERLSREKTPTLGSHYYPYKVNHDDELPGFLEMIQEQAGGKAPIHETNGLTIYAMPKPARLLDPSERTPPGIFPKTVFWRKDPSLITAGDLAYGLAHNLPGWDRNTYRGILKNTGDWGKDYEESARALMYDVKAQLYKKMAMEKGGPLTANEFAEGLWDLNKRDFLKAFQNAHGGHYLKEVPLTFDINNLAINDLTKIIDVLTKYRNGGKLYKKSIKFNK